MAALSPLPSLQDLDLKFHELTLVFPAQETEKKSIFLSNSDQLFNVNIQTAHFFKANLDFPLENVAKRVKTALEKVLVPYHFVAGRLKMNQKLGRLEIDCNAAGAGYVVASSEVSLDEIEVFLPHPNLGFRQLAAQKIDDLVAELDQPLCVVQVTSFSCGGFAIGLTTNHSLFDGMGAKIFLENLASQAFDDNRPLAVIPCTDRRLLAARCLPIVAFPHHEFHLPGSNPPALDGTHDKFEYRIFKFSPVQIAQLKARARNPANATARISSFAVVAAVVWRCKAYSDKEHCKKDQISTVLNVINIRGRVNPPLPVSYSGNAVLPMGVSATHEELESGPFCNVVELISEGANKMTDEYAKSALDWLEVHRGFPYGNYFVISWMRLGFDQVIYPWGKPIYSCPVVYDKDNVSFIFPDAMDGGIGVVMALPAKRMERFEAVFHKFFA